MNSLKLACFTCVTKIISCYKTFQLSEIEFSCFFQERAEVREGVSSRLRQDQQSCSRLSWIKLTRINSYPFVDLHHVFLILNKYQKSFDYDMIDYYLLDLF